MRDRRQARQGRRGWLGLRPGSWVVILVAAAFLPLIALHAYSVTQITTEQRLHLEHDVEDLAEAASLIVEGTVNSALSTARALSEVPAIHVPEAAQAEATLARILPTAPEYSNLWAANADGSVFASALPSDVTADIGDEAYFQAARQRLEPVVTTSRNIPGLPGVFAPLIAVPVLPDSQFRGTVQVAFDLSQLDQLPAHAGLPENAVATVLDGQGVVAFRSLQPERWVGVSIAGLPIYRQLRTATGAFVSPSLDGVERLLAAAPVPGTDWLAVVGLPAGEALGPLDATLNREIALFALTVALSGVLAWRGKVLADELEDERRRLEGTIDQLPEGVFVAAPDGRVLRANRALGELLGIHFEAGSNYREQIEGRVTWLEDGQPVPWDDLPTERARRGVAVRGAQLTVLRPDESRRDLLVNALPLFGAGGGIDEIVIVAADVTALKELDRAKDEFISIAAHELRNPLAGLKGYTEILLRQSSQRGYDPETVRILETTNRLADRLNAMVGRLLDVSRLELGRLELVRQPTDLAALSREIAESLQLTTEQHRIVVDADPTHVTGEWDADRLRQVLNNLVGNAIKYAPGGLISIILRREGEQADLFVSDQGPGIPPEQQARLFGRFRQAGRTARERAGGLGLGLYLAKGIIEAHGGLIGVESEPGQGATFWFTLPLAAGGVAHEPASELLAQARAAGRAVRSPGDGSSQRVGA